MNKGLYEKYFKRILDFSLSLIALIVLLPLILITAILVRFKLGSPVLFVQERPGLNNKIFKMFKFRTMTDEKDEEGNLLPDTIRLTSFGRFLRLTSLDELPGLINIVKGDMSLVGPRPLAVQYLPYYNENEIKRHNVRPGLTGLAQTKGRSNVNWPERFAYDLEYISNLSFINDFKIIINTVIIVIKRDNIEVRGTNNILDFDEYRKKTNYQVVKKNDK